MRVTGRRMTLMGRPRHALARALPFGLAALVIPSMVSAPANAVTGASLCDDARAQVVAWSLEHAKDRGRPYVLAIKRTVVSVNRATEFPADGVVLRCFGRARLSNDHHTRVTFGFRAVEGAWYLFLRRA